MSLSCIFYLSCQLEHYGGLWRKLLKEESKSVAVLVGPWTGHRSEREEMGSKELLGLF